VHELTRQNIHLILSDEYWYNSSTTGLYRPLTTFSYLLNYAVFGNGPNPAGYHWVNFLLHAANISLVYLLGLRLLEDSNLAVALAALWGVHPLLTESVTNVVGRADLLAALGVLAGLQCHISALFTSGRRKLAWLGAMAVAAGIGIFSKESAAVLPGIMLLYDWTWPSLASWRRRAPGYLAMALPFAVFFSLRADLHARLPIGLVPYGDNPLFGAGFWTARLTAVKIVGKLIGLFLWPINQSADYSYNSVPLARWPDAGALIALAVCLAAAVLAIRSYRTAKPLFFFLAFFFITLAPTSNLLIPIGSIMAERFLYLPSAGLAGCVVWSVRALCRRLAVVWPGAPRAAWIAVGLICLTLAARTYTRNLVWLNELSLWTSTASASPENFKAHSTLADILARSGPRQLDRAVAEADRTLAIMDSLPDEWNTSRPYATAGWCYRLKGDSLSSPATAVGWYRKALATLVHGARVDAAERQQIRRINLDRGKRASVAGWMPLYLEMGRVYLRLNDPQKALEPLAYGRSHSPDPEFAVEMSHAWRAEGNWERAAIVLIEAVEDAAMSTALTAELVSLYKQAAPASCAVREAGGALSVDLNCPLVRGHVCAASQDLGSAYRQAGQTARAEAMARSAAQNFGCPAP